MSSCIPVSRLATAFTAVTVGADVCTPNPRACPACRPLLTGATFLGGADLSEAFEQMLLSMFDYMTSLDTIGIDPGLSRTFVSEGLRRPLPNRRVPALTTHVAGHDMHSLLYNLMDECLYIFSTEFFTPRVLKVIEFDKSNFKIRVEA